MKLIRWLQMHQPEPAVLLGASLLLLLFCGSLREELPVLATREPTSEHLCRMHTPDVGEIIGRGADKSTALADAIEQCHRRRESQYERLHQSNVDLNHSVVLATSCANLACQYDVSTL
jgi:hypothetical protein